MKKIIRTAVAIAAFATVLADASAQNIQGITSEAASQKLNIPTMIQSRATLQSDRPSMGITMVERTAVRASLLDQAADLTAGENNAVSAQIATSVAEISNGGRTNFIIQTNSSASLLDQYSVEVKVSYDPRPIGGILNVKVSFVPMFSGIGIANRPIATRAIARAVDDISQASISAIVADLSKSLAAEIGA